MDGEGTGACPISPGDVIVGKGPPNMREGGGGKTAELIPATPIPTPPTSDEGEEEECGDRTEEEEEEEAGRP